MPHYQNSLDKSLEELATTPRGLSSSEAQKRLKSYGLNTIRLRGEPLWRKLVEPFANIFMIVLSVAVIISLWHNAVLDAIIIGAIMLISAAIYYAQRFSTDRILKALQKRSAQRVEVMRDGDLVLIDVAHLVPGDIIHLGEGDKVPADIRLITSENCRVDESVLTGESEAVNKQIEALVGQKATYEQTNMLFEGSFIISGRASGVVVLTGNHTEFGRIAALAGETPHESRSPVQKKIDKLVAYVIVVVSIIAVIAFILALVRGTEFSEALRFVIALSVSAVPENLPVALSVIMVLGMRRMASKKALIRSMAAIETIGVITTIATDKTGTLTENRLTVQEVWQPRWTKHNLALLTRRAINDHSERMHDPLDVAMLAYATAEKSPQPTGSIVAQLPFDQSMSMSGNVWNKNGKYELIVKGAPEQILEHSTLDDSGREEAAQALKALTSQGYRVIALASTNLAEPITAFSELKKQTSYKFLGFLAVADTLRPAARRAIVTAQNAGVTVRMITGDHFETAYAIGAKLGLVESRDQVFDSRQMDKLTDKQLAKAVAGARVFSRVTPENKFRILEVLRLKEITAMTGDGVNDVPALAHAHVGVAMGSGSQIAKEAGDIILLNDNFASIVGAMKEGRVIFSNIRRMVVYLLSTNTGEVLTTLGALVIGMPMPLTPIQILWINLVTDTTMVIPLGLEPGEKETMKRRPASPTAPLLSRYMIERMILVAIVMAVLALSFYGYYSAQYGTAYGQTIAFIALVAVQWGNAFNARSTYQSLFTRIKVWSPSFYIGLALSLGLQVLVLFGPLAAILHIQPVSLIDIGIVSGVAIAAAIIPVEIHKFIGRRLHTKDS